MGRNGKQYRCFLCAIVIFSALNLHCSNWSGRAIGAMPALAPSVGLEEQAQPDDYVSPSAWLKQASAMDRVHFQTALRKMVGTTDLKKPEMSRNHLAAAQKYCQDDPRTLYLFGLSEWNRGANDSALKQLRLASQLDSSEPYFPAGFAILMLKLQAGETEGALGEIPAFTSALVRKAKQGSNCRVEPWVCRLAKVTAFYRGPGRCPASQGFADHWAETVEASLPDSMKSLLARAEQEAITRNQQWAKLADVPMTQWQSAQDTIRQQIAEQLADGRREQSQLHSKLTNPSTVHRQVVTDCNEQLAQIGSSIQQSARFECVALETAMALSVPQNYMETRQVFYPVAVTSESKHNHRQQTGYQYQPVTYNAIRQENANERSMRMQEQRMFLQVAASIEGQIGQQQAEGRAVQTKRQNVMAANVQRCNEQRQAFTEISHKNRNLQEQLARLDQESPSPTVAQTHLQSVSANLGWSTTGEIETVFASLRCK